MQPSVPDHCHQHAERSVIPNILGRVRGEPDGVGSVIVGNKLPAVFLKPMGPSRKIIGDRTADLGTENTRTRVGLDVSDPGLPRSIVPRHFEPH